MKRKDEQKRDERKLMEDDYDEMKKKREMLKIEMEKMDKGIKVIEKDMRMK